MRQPQRMTSLRPINPSQLHSKRVHRGETQLPNWSQSDTKVDLKERESVLP